MLLVDVLGVRAQDEIEGSGHHFLGKQQARAARGVRGGSALGRLKPGISLEQALQARDQWNGKGRIEASLLTWTALFPQFLNPNPTLVADLTFRRALLYALDRQELSDSLQAGFSPVADTLLSPNDPEYPGIESSIAVYTSAGKTPENCR